MPPSVETQAVTQALTDLYTTVLKMSNRSTTEIQTPPPEGHTLPPNLLAALTQHNKSPEVIDLIRHLPFAAVHIGPGSEVTDYLHDKSSYYDYWIQQAWRPLKFGSEALVLPEDLPITGQWEESGSILVINTKDWTARAHDSLSTYAGDCSAHSDPDAGECPLLCRYQKGVEIGPAAAMLQQWRRNFIECRWMVDRGVPEVICRDWPEEYVEKLRETYLAHGWPDNFRAAECRQVLENLPPPDDDYYTFGTEDEDDDEED